MSEEVISVTKTHQDCLDSTSSDSALSTNTFCHPEWDGQLCWNKTAAGQSAILPCPIGNGISNSDTNQFAIRHCSLDSQWEESADYSACLVLIRKPRGLPDSDSGSPGDADVINDSNDLVTSAVIAQQTNPDVVDDGNLLDVTTAPSSATPAFLATQAAVPSHGMYIYDFYHEVDVVQVILHGLSIIMLVTAIVFWCAVWYSSRHCHPYRYVSFVVILFFSFLYHLIGLLGLLVYVPTGVGCQLMLTLKSYGDLGMCTFFFLYVILCIGVAMRRLEFGMKFYFLVVFAVMLPLILVGATTSVRLLLHPQSACDLLDELSHHLWYDRAPKCLLLFGTVCVLSVLFYWLFCFDNTLFKLNKDFLLIRHSSATLMILVCFFFFLELYEIVFLSHGVDGKIKSEGLATYGLILDILICTKGSVAAFLLCFLDLEIFNAIHTFPCCPDIHDAVIDQGWEKKIRSESKVKFFEDPSSEEDMAGPSGISTPDKESDRVLAQLQNITRYGSVPEESEENQ